jgi:ATP-binding cassette subfamily B protein
MLMKRKVLSFSKNFLFIVRLTYQVNKKLFLLNTFFYLLMAVLPLVSLWVLKILVDRIIEIRQIFDVAIYGYVALFIVIQLLQSFVQQWSAYYLQKQQYLMGEHISMQVLKKAAEIDYAYFEDPEFYDSLHLTQQQSAYLPAQIINSLQTLFQQVIMVLALAAFLVSVHWSIPFLLVLFSLPLAVSRMYFGQRQFKLEKNIVPDQRKAYDLFNYVTNHAHAKELRIFSFGSYFIELYQQLQKKIFNQRNQLQYVYMQKSMLITFFEVLFVTAFYLILISKSIGGAITVGGLIIYFQAFQRLQTSVNGIFKSGTSLFQNQLYLQEIVKYLSLPGRYEKVTTFKKELINDGFNIDISNLYFKYPNTGKDVLRDINMHFEKGKFIAVVGENGSGKSTLLKLLCGLYNTDRGGVYFGGINANDLSTSFFSKHISVVFQDFGKYYMTVEDNIALGLNQADPQRLEKAMDDATGSDILISLQSGMQTTLGRTHKLGEELSGGQWQKIAIARALYKKHQILILDEPTSAIDPLAELKFFSHIKKEIGDKIVILITHRLHNLKLADQIYVMNEGEVGESGTFESLMEHKGYFYRYYQAQQL